jgi:hypothetical protein
MAEHHTILGGKVHVFKRPNSSSWQCATYLAGKNRRTTTKEDSLSKAKEFAEDWYLQLRGKLRDGQLKSGKLFRDAAKLYLREFDIMTQGQRNPKYASQQHTRANGHLVAFFGSMVLPEITAGKVNEYRLHRLEECKAMRGKPPAPKHHAPGDRDAAPDLQDGSAARMDRSSPEFVSAISRVGEDFPSSMVLAGRIQAAL